MLVDAVIFAIAGYSLVFAIAVVVSASNCAMGAVVSSDQSRCFVEYICLNILGQKISKEFSRISV